MLKIIKILTLITFILGSCFILIYPFQNRNLKIVITTNKGNYEFYKTGKDINNEELDELLFLDFGGETSVKIKNIKIYAEFNSICIKKINHSELSDNYIEEVSKGEVHWEKNALCFSGPDGISVTFNKSFNKMLQKQSKTFLMERIMMLEVLVVVSSLMLIICKFLDESLKKDKNYHSPVYEVKKFIDDIKKYRQYMIYAARTDLKAEVANSYLNRLWWLLEPFFNMLVYVIVFGKVMGSSVENYVIYIFSSLLMWNFFSKTINYSVQLIRNNRDIVSKVYVPKFIILLSNMFLNMFKLFFSMIVLLIMLVVFRVHIGLNCFWVLPSYFVMFLLAFGLGMIFLHFGVYVDDLSYAVGILLSMLMFLSGIFYEVMEALPTPLNTIIMCLNPVAIFIDTMRNALLNNTLTNFPTLGIWFVISVILCFVGVHIVYKNENSYVKVV